MRLEFRPEPAICHDAAMADEHIPTDPEDLDLAWFLDVLPPARGATGFSHTPVGTGLMARSYRVSFAGGGIDSVVVKLPSADAPTRELGASAYIREVGFYRDVAARLVGSVPMCHHAVVSDDGQAFALILEDIHPAEQGDQLLGCSVTEARRALTTMAHLHAETWGDMSIDELAWAAAGRASALADFMGFAMDAFATRFVGMLDDATWPVLRRFTEAATTWHDNQPATLAAVHGDYRLDNLLFRESGPAVAVDWQTVSVVNPGRDLAYFLGNSLTVDDRRLHERDLVAHYRAELGARGIDYPEETCWSDLRHGTFQGPLVTMLGAFTASRTERSEGMFAAMADRSAAQILDLDALELLS